MRLDTAGLSRRDANLFAEGLVILPAFVDRDRQRELVCWALSEHARAPNETNLDAHYALPPNGLWNARVHDPSLVIYPKLPAEGAHVEPEGPRQLINNTPASIDTLDVLNALPKPPPTPSPNAKPASAFSLLPKLRWANIGYSYHWGSKSYDFSRGDGVFPEQIGRLCRQAVASVDWSQVWDGIDVNGWGDAGPDWQTWARDYLPDAGIVNFYQLTVRPSSSKRAI